MRKTFLTLSILLASIACLPAQVVDTAILLKPDRVFDGENMHSGWWVLVKKNIIVAAGEPDAVKPSGVFRTITLPGATLLPGFIEGHSHLFLHPYNETKWDEQVMNESRAERTARAVIHARKTLMAGFTTVRDLGTEGADYDDVGLKTAIEKNIIPGPRMIVATRAIVATGSYGPKQKNLANILIRGAAEADGQDALIKEVRTQIGNGADVIKIYADYRWGIDKDVSEPTFTLEELKTVVSVASSAGRKVVAHAGTEEGIRRSVLAGVSTIEHGDNATEEIFDLMLKNKTAFCATLSATEATSQYNGWDPRTPPPPRILTKKKTFALALQKGVKICFGGDVGVFAHGDNAREMEAMAAYGMKPLDILRSATSVNADVFGYAGKIGRIKQGLMADLVAVGGNPADNISDVRKTMLVMKGGTIYVNNIQ